MIDAAGPVQDFPATSLLTGLIANALGWRRGDTAALQALQDRLVHAVRIDREGERVRDYQTAKLEGADQGWTRAGAPEGRAGDAGTYKHPHPRYRWYQADASVLVALRLEPAEEAPTLDDVASALDRPARPLFIGRKPCLPSVPLIAGWADGETASAAVAAGASSGDLRLFWPAGEGVVTRDRRETTGRRNWRSGVHAGRDVWFGGRVMDLAP
jgi:CRISPR system Cascade subunit CasD